MASAEKFRFIVAIMYTGSEPRNSEWAFGIVAIPTHLVVIPFLKVPSFVKAHAHGTDSLTLRRLLLFIYL